MAIKFVTHKDGKSTARVDELEINIFPKRLCSEYLVEIWVFENIIEVPCDYKDCPTGLKSEECTLYTGDIEECLYCTEKEQYSSHLSFSANDVAEIKNEVLSLFKNNKDGFGHQYSWPQPAASKFVNEKWALKIDEAPNKALERVRA